MHRRSFIANAVRLAIAASAGGALLSGCGGGGSEAGVMTTTTQGKLLLPGGVPAGMQVVNGYGNATVAADGAFSLTTLADVPSMAMALDAAGKLVLFGYLDPTSSSNSLDTRAAALAQLFLSLGGAQASRDDKKALLAALGADSSLGPLAAAIEARLLVDPLAFHNADAGIRNALVTARTQVRAVHAREAGEDHLVHAAALPPRMVIQPAAQQSGVELIQDPARDGVIIPVNHHRRWCKVFHYRVGFEGASGTRQDLPTAEALNNGDALDSVPPAGGVFTTIPQLLSGTSAWVPVNGKPFSPVMKDGEVKTYLETVVVGSAATFNEPAFFTAPRYASQAPLWREVRERMNHISFVVDLALGLLLEQLGVRGAVADFNTCNATAAAWEDIDNIAMRNVVAKARAGQLPRAMLELIEACVGSEGPFLVRELATKSAKFVATIAGEKVLVNEALWAVGFKALSNLIFGAAGLVVGAVDLGAVVTELSAANQADLWTTTLIQPTVAISPATITLGAGQETNLTASVPGAQPNATFSYKWTLSGSNLASLRGDNKSGSSIETTSSTIALTTTPSVKGTLTVKVEAYQLGDGGSKTLVGDAKSTITVTDASTTVELFLDTYQLDATYSRMAAFLVFPLPVAHPKKYRITVGSSLGMYNGPEVYEIDPRDIINAGPEKAHLLDQDKIYAYHISGTRNDGWWFYKRNNKLYMYFDSFQYYPSGNSLVILGNVFDGPRTVAGMEAEMQRRAASFTVLYEQLQ